jgi:hypothetical protein
LQGSEALEFLRKNTALSLGVGLPLLLVILFALASVLPRYFVAPPSHELLFATDYYDYSEGVRFEVKNQKLDVFYVGEKSTGYSPPKFFRFNPKTMEVRQIRYELPDAVPTRDDTKPYVENKTVYPITLAETDGLKLYPELSAPDGYVFIAGDYYRAGRGFLFDVFYSPGYRATAMIAKSGNMISVPLPNEQSYVSGVKFIGWIEQ